MSLLWPDELQVTLARDRIGFLRLGGWRRKIIARGSQLLEAGADPWAAAIAALRRIIAESAGRRLNVSVILSDDFVRYRLLPWNDGIKDESEWLALARHEFTKSHGPAAREWVVCSCATGAHAPRLAVAIHARLLSAIRSACEAPRVRLASIQPFFIAFFNRYPGKRDRLSAWIVTEELERIVFGLIENGNWRMLRSRRQVTGSAEALAELLERESALANIEKPCERVRLCSEVPDRKSGRLGRFQIEATTFERCPTSQSPLSRVGTFATHRLELDYSGSTCRAAWVSAALMLIAVVFAGDLAFEYRLLSGDIERKELRLARLSENGPEEGRTPHRTVSAEEMNNARDTIRRLSMPWGALFGAIENMPVEGVALLSIEPDTETGTVLISGEAKNYLTVLNYVSGLSESKPLRNVRLAHHEDQQKGQRTVLFTISAGWAEKS